MEIAVEANSATDPLNFTPFNCIAIYKKRKGVPLPRLPSLVACPSLPFFHFAGQATMLLVITIPRPAPRTDYLPRYHFRARSARANRYPQSHLGNTCLFKYTIFTFCQIINIGTKKKTCRDIGQLRERDESSIFSLKSVICLCRSSRTATIAFSKSSADSAARNLFP